ncbi:MAG: hypothetical protein V5804_04200 [Mucilaginibacter sp.]|uniref:hypothetical protein n=1 Tax=Mucilaginibacter sp. TaxID=1882438 RepID=UPI0034E4C7AF
MGYIKEPDGVDFIVNGKPLTDQQKQEISEFIRADKEKRKLKELHSKARKAKSKQPV